MLHEFLVEKLFNSLIGFEFKGISDVELTETNTTITNTTIDSSNKISD